MGSVAMTHSITRRSALALIMGSAALAACAPPAPQAPPAAPQAPAGAPQQPTSGATQKPAANQPRAGGTLRMGLASEPANVDGHTRTPGAAESVWLAFDRLTQYDDKLKAQPALAESWDLASDYTSIKLNLRKGVIWHSGRELTSEDVKWNFLRVRDP